MSTAWTILACGDASRGDDGAAIAALERLPRDVAAMAVVHRVGMLEPGDLVAATRGGSCVVLDAVRGIEPGSVVALPVTGLAALDAPAPASSHALPLEVVIGLAEALGADLDSATFIGIGGADFGLGHGLSEAVRAALDRYASRIAWSILEEDAPRCA